MSKPRIMYILYEYPQLSQTYIKSEIDALKKDYEIFVVALHKHNISYKNHAPYKIISSPAEILSEIKKFKPHVLHSHWMFMANLLSDLSKKTGIPFTIRSHSFDVLPTPPLFFLPGIFLDILRYIKWRRLPPVKDMIKSPKKFKMPWFIVEAAPSINSDLCLGILVFPFLRKTLEQCGIRSDKIHDSYPVMNYKLFYDTSPNGKGIMNVGSCTRKKKMEDFLYLAKHLPDKTFNLYAMGKGFGYMTKKLQKLNNSLEKPIDFIEPLEPEDMPKEFKKHEWLVYTGCPKIGTVGWSIVAAEAQAAGVGVCFPNLRPDIKEFIGDAGYVYNSIEEVAEIISKPFPMDKRKRGFEQAKKSDIAEHKEILLNLWEKVG